MKNIFLCFILISANLFSQRSNIWYFGDHVGIDFNSGTAVALNTGAQSAVEGTASICDEQGQLQFYTTGGQYLSYDGGVWNRNHQLMPHGNLNGLSGCQSAFQSSLIVPDPADTNKYYLFTLDCVEHNLQGGLRFNVIDMTLDSGNGDLTVIDSLLNDSMLECQAAITDNNGNGYWLVAHKWNTNNFISYHITSNGISAPVYSYVGPMMSSQTSGGIKISCDGRKLGFGWLQGGSIFDFNNSTGLLSNEISLLHHCGSCEFSADCRYFYAGDQGYGYINQFDLLAPNVAASIYTLSCPQSFWLNMQIGPDKKIYVADYSNNTLSVINSPDNAGASCNFTAYSFTLSSTPRYSLPNFCADLIHPCNSVLWVQNEQRENNAIRLFPIPASNEIIVSEIPKYANRICISNLLGEELINYSPVENSDVRMDIKSLPEGIYFLIIYTDDEISYSKKFIKE